MRQKNTQESSDAFSRWKNFWLIVAVLWLQAVVVVCIVLEIRQLHIPVSDWLERAIHLVGK
jgi:hypothetical protein